MEKYSKAIEGIVHGQDQGDKALDMEKKQDQQPSKVSQSQVPAVNGALFSQDLIFKSDTSAPVRANFKGHAQAKQVGAAMSVDFTPVSANFSSSLKVNKAVSVISALDNISLKICLRLKESLRESYDEIMNYNCPLIENQEQTALQMIRLQAAQQQQQAVQLNTKLQRAGCNSSPNSFNSFSTHFNNGSPDNMPGKKHERNFISRHASSAPPELMGCEALQPCNMGGNGGGGPRIRGVVGGTDASCNADNDDGKPKKQMKRRFKRRLSVASTSSHEHGMLKEKLFRQDKKKLKGERRVTVQSRDDNFKLGNSFQGEPENGMFTWVPIWEKEDAKNLLDLLKAP